MSQEQDAIKVSDLMKGISFINPKYFGYSHDRKLVTLMLEAGIITQEQFDQGIEKFGETTLTPNPNYERFGGKL